MRCPARNRPSALRRCRRVHLEREHSNRPPAASLVSSRKASVNLDRRTGSALGARPCPSPLREGAEKRVVVVLREIKNRAGHPGAGGKGGSSAMSAPVVCPNRRGGGVLAMP